MSRFLVAGGAGFLGSHLCEHLLLHDHEIICVDRHDDMPFIKDGRAEICYHNVCQPLPRFIGDIDYVLHFASHASPKDFLNFPLETLFSNSVGTEHLLELAKEKDAVFLFPSSAQVYLDIDPASPRALYLAAKRYAEALTLAAGREKQIKTKIVRMYNVYGPGMRPDDGRVVPTFIQKALRGEDINILGGMQLVSFTYVDDVMDCLTRFIFSDETGPIDVGNPHMISILNLAKEIIYQTKSKSKINLMPEVRKDERPPDMDGAKRLNWEPSTSIAEGLKRTIEYYGGIE